MGKPLWDIKMPPLTADTLNTDGAMMLCEEILRLAGREYRSLAASASNRKKLGKQIFDPAAEMRNIELFIKTSPIAHATGADPEALIKSLRRQAETIRRTGKCRESKRMQVLNGRGWL